MSVCSVLRSLREEMYRAYITRASSKDLDNTPIIEKILQLRQEKAELLGFKNFADLSMASKMATYNKAEELLEELRSSSYASAQVREYGVYSVCQVWLRALV